MSGFVLDARLDADTAPVCDLPLCALRLMRDARFAWIVLVPRIAGAVEIVDLGPSDRQVLMEEMAQASQALRQSVPCDKLNVGALGNIVQQLHVHVVARRQGDAAWPGPVWGSGAAQPRGDRHGHAAVGLGCRGGRLPVGGALGEDGGPVPAGAGGEGQREVVDGGVSEPCGPVVKRRPRPPRPSV